MKNKLPFLVFFITSFFLEGQNLIAIDSISDFVNLEENYIHFYSKEANLDTFYSKLDSLLKYKKGKVKILQIGGSHIQAEIWPDQIRKNLLQLSDSINGGRGFVFPFEIAKTWNPKNHQISYMGEWKAQRNSLNKHHAVWGLSGITVTTKDTLTFFSVGYKHDSLTNYTFNSIKIFHEIRDTSFEVDLVSEKPLEKIINEELGFTEFVLEKETDTLSVEIKKINSIQNHFTLYGLSLENDRPGIVYTSVGVNGAKTSSFLRNSLFVKQLETIKPDLVIFCLGINDAYNPNFCDTCYEENYYELVSWFQAVNPNTNFLFVTNNDSYYKRKYANRNVLKARKVMVNLATKNNAGMWDLFEVMGGLNSIKKWEKKGFAKEDKIHFTNKGYQLIGDLMFIALMKEFKIYKNNN